MTNSKLKRYPLLFEPNYKSLPWGGTRFVSWYQRDPGIQSNTIGESWEICDYPGENESVVENGPLAGMTLRQLVENAGTELVGRNFRSGRFPLLVKLLDAEKHLSLQVHPDRRSCEILRNGAQPKTEMWYIIATEKSSKIFAGVREGISADDFFERVHTLCLDDMSKIENMLCVFDSKPGETYLVRPGCLHAIGAGNLLLEIQQNSNTTFRITDWNRRDDAGNLRKLHIPQCKVSIHFDDHSVAPSQYRNTRMIGQNRAMAIVPADQCDFFCCDELKLTEPWLDSTDNGRCFVILTAIDRDVSVECADGTALIPRSRSCLIPACAGDFRITVSDGTAATVIRTTCKL